MTRKNDPLALADRLAAYADRQAFGLDELASLDSLESAARAYNRIQERWCSEEMDEPTRIRVEKREKTLMLSIANLAKALPEPWYPDGLHGQWVAVFEGDPRGFTVALVPVAHDAYPGEASRVRRETNAWVGVA